MRRKKVFVSGSWRAKEGQTYEKECLQLGKLLAERGFDLVIGPGTGIARCVIDGYRSVKDRGEVIFYLPRLKEMKRVGEEMEEGADKVVTTEQDYPTRNLIMIRKSDAVIAVNGFAGTLTEIIAAVLDYHKPTAALENSGEAVTASKLLEHIREHIFYSDSIEKIVDYIETELKKSEKKK